jgi:mannosylfructose-phosphate synthase
VPDGELPNYYAAADAYLFLERNVPFGMTVLEAAASGTPSITPRGGATTDTVVHEKTGFLVDESLSIPEIATCILSIVQSDSMRQAMKHQAKEHASKYTWRRYAQQVHDSFIRATAE